MKKLLTLFVLMLVAIAVNAQSSMSGDVDGDGTVSVTDVAWIVNHILGVANDNIIAANADINGDGEIDINDVMGAVNTILEGEQGEPPLQLSMDTLNITINHDGSSDQKSVAITSGSGSYTVTSSNASVATAAIEDSMVYVTAKGEGMATITVTDTKSGQIAAIQVRVSQAYLTCPDDNHPHIIDLGLPSGTKWACCNVGADKPEAYGGYYAWGETEEKSVYNPVTYQYATGVDEDGNGRYDDYHSDTGVFGVYQNLGDIAGTKYDVAHVKGFGPGKGSWVMPSFDQIDELLYSNCYCEWTTVNGVDGAKFTSRLNGGTIFLPAAGERRRDYLGNVGSRGDYWASTQSSSDSDTDTDLAYCLYFDSGWAYWSYNYYGGYRYYGHTVRPVSR